MKEKTLDQQILELEQNLEKLKKQKQRENVVGFFKLQIRPIFEDGTYAIMEAIRLKCSDEITLSKIKGEQRFNFESNLTDFLRILYDKFSKNKPIFETYNSTTTETILYANFSYIDVRDNFKINIFKGQIDSIGLDEFGTLLEKSILEIDCQIFLNKDRRVWDTEIDAILLVLTL